MRRNYCWIAAFALLWLSSCCAMPKPRVPEAVVKTRWIGVTKPWLRQCPAADPATGWAVRPLFPLAGKDQDLQRSARQAGLTRFCVAEYTGPDKDPKLPRALSLRLSRAEPDSIALTTAADVLKGMTAAPFFDRFSAHVKRPTPFPVADLAGPRVRLAFLDTQPTGVGISSLPGAGELPLRSDHGYSLTQIAGYLEGLEPVDPGAAGGGSARTARVSTDSGPLQVTSQLALSGPEPDLDESREETALSLARRAGGVVGSFEGLNRAIWNEVTEWREQARDPGDPQHLVLNLSIGWDGEKFGGWEKVSKMTPTIQAVYRALRFAADQGVLIIAAAGNDRPCPRPTQRPLLPAGWESLGGWLPHKSPSRPLLYAVSGVDGKDKPLVNTRTKGEAPLVAYGDHVVVPDLHDGRLYTATLTGTSVASAVVSTIAALVWRHRSDLTPAGVMKLVADSGERLRRRPDFPASASEPVRRISLCPALVAACPSCADLCKPPLASPPAPIEDTLVPFVAEHTMSGAVLTQVLEEDRCRLSPIFFDPSRRPANPCPSEHLPNLVDQPWIGTQPGVDPCPNCIVTRVPPEPPPGTALLLRPSLGMLAADPETLYERSESPYASPTYKLRIEIPDAFDTFELQGATLEVSGFNANDRKLPLSGCSIANVMHNGNSLEVTDLCFGKPETPFQAVLTFTLATPGATPGTGIFSIQSPLFVEN